MAGPRLAWWVVVPDGQGRTERLRHTATMRGAWPGWEVTCSCGWESRTGGGVRHWVRELAFDHLVDEHGIVRVNLLTH